MLKIHKHTLYDTNSENDIYLRSKKIGTIFNCSPITIITFDDTKNIDISKQILNKYSNTITIFKNSWIKTIDSISRKKLFPIFDDKNILYLLNDRPIDSKTLWYKENFEEKDLKSSMIMLNELGEITYLNSENRKALSDLVRIMFENFKDKIPFMLSHPYNVAHLSKQIALKMKLDDQRINNIYIAALLHDIGKIHVDSNILNKKSKLTPEEYALVKAHSIYGYNMVKEISGFEDIALFIKHHHERIDGTGYPNKLRGEDIPLESRIIAVADSIDAMFSQRSYKPQYSTEYVIDELIINSNKQFDIDIVDIAIELLMAPKNNDIRN